MSRGPLYPHVPKSRKKGERGRRTAYYIQFWSPKSDPMNAQPYYWGDAYLSLREALDAANRCEEKRPDAFGIEIYSQEERWEPYEEYPEIGRWEVIENTMRIYDRRGAVIYDESSPELLPQGKATVTCPICG